MMSAIPTAHLAVGTIAAPATAGVILRPFGWPVCLPVGLIASSTIVQAHFSKPAIDTRLIPPSRAPYTSRPRIS
jgi:hypothetical protein